MHPPLLLVLQVAILDGDEQRFLEASMAYSAGKPIMSDEDFDALKNELRIRGSIVSAQVWCWAPDPGVWGVCLQHCLRTVHARGWCVVVQWMHVMVVGVCCYVGAVQHLHLVWLA
jgi:hypothetical protein